MEKPPFDPDAEYEVAQDFIITGPTHVRGEAFDKSLVTTRLLRRLYTIGLVRLSTETPAVNQNSVVFVPTQRRGRA